MVVVLWVGAYGALTTERAFAGARLLPHYTSWLVLGLATFGVPLLARAWWRVPAGRVAFLVAGVAAVHFLYDPHASPLPLWEGRRFVPAALPLLFAAAAVAVAWSARFRSAAGVGLALAAVATNLVPSRLLWRTPYLAGSSRAVAGIVALIPEDNAVVLVDPAFFASLLDVPLWLIHGREAIQSSGVAGDVASVGTMALLMAKAGRPLYLVRHSMLPPPTQPQVQFTPVGEAVYPVMPIGDSATQLLPARVYRVTWTAPLTFQGLTRP